MTEVEAWVQNNLELVNLKIQQAGKTFPDRYANRLPSEPHGNRWGQFVSWVDSRLERADAWTEKLYEIWLEVWDKQRKTRTPEFLRVVLQSALVPAIEARIGSAKFNLTLMATRLAMVNTAPLLQRLVLEKSRLISEWTTRVEIEARELELELRIPPPSVAPKARAGAAKGPSAEPYGLPPQESAEGPATDMARDAKPYYEYPKTLYHLTYQLDGTTKTVQDSDEENALGPEWFQRPDYASAAFDLKPQREQLEIASRSKDAPTAMDRLYQTLFDAAPGRDKLRVVMEYRNEYPHLAVHSNWARQYLDRIPPVLLVQQENSKSGDQGEAAVTPPRKAAKQYFKGFDGLPAKEVDMSGYYACADLTPRQRDCFSLRKEYGLPLAEVAGRLGIDRKTADEHIQNAEKKISLQWNKRRDQSGRVKKPPITE